MAEVIAMIRLQAGPLEYRRLICGRIRHVCDQRYISTGSKVVSFFCPVCTAEFSRGHEARPLASV